MPRRWWSIGLLCVCAALALALLIYPLYVIQPFKFQAPVDLQRALFILRIAPVTVLIAAAFALITAVFSWGSLKFRQRTAAVLLVALSCAAAALVRINVFEKMFHPAGVPRFVSAGNGKLDPADMLLTVALNGDAHAYPIRAMGYHHVVNDFVGGEPIVATY